MKVSTFLNVEIIRDVTITLHKFIDYFKGFEKVEAVKEIFGDQTEGLLNQLKVEFVSRRGYMGVDEQDGHLIVSAYYLKSGSERDIYLDIVHELVHVKQWMHGQKLFDHRFDRRQHLRLPRVVGRGKRHGDAELVGRETRQAGQQEQRQDQNQNGSFHETPP